MTVVPRTGIFRYVKHDRADAYLRLGWHNTMSLRECHHGEYAELFVWLCDCKAVEPKRTGPDEDRKDQV
jgi:hypothetical protein